MNDILDVRSIGGALRETSEDVVDLTHDFAAKHLAMPSFAGERKIRERHVSNLLSHMQRGTFFAEWVNLITCRCKEECVDIGGAALPPGTVWRMNGQHTCRARLEMPPGYKCRVKIYRYSAETAYDMRQLYASIDRGGIRTSRNVWKSYLAGAPEFSGRSVRCIERVPSGYAHWKFGDVSFRSGRTRDADDVVFLMHTEDYQLTCKVMAFLDRHGEADTLWVWRAGVVAGIYATFDRDAVQGEKFWESVVTGVGFTSLSDPRNKLNRLLSTTSADGRSNGSKAVSRETYFRWCIAAWNAWREGRDIKAFRCPDKRVPLK